jgi:hypothetical protein
MSVDHRIDDLITAGWYVLDSDFEPAALQNWRVKAFHCCDALLGSHHVTTRHFEDRVYFGPWTEFTKSTGVEVTKK